MLLADLERHKVNMLYRVSLKFIYIKLPYNSTILDNHMQLKD